MSSAAAEILDYIRSEERLLIAVLRELVEAESPSSHPESHRMARNAFRSHLADAGLITRAVRTPDGPVHVFARPTERRKRVPLQLVIGHFDTVWPLGTLGKRPFTVDGNVVRGPGTVDMKGGLAQIVLAFRALEALRLTPSLTPVVFANADEEIGSRSSTRLIRRLAQRANRALIVEPALGPAGDLKTERKGIGRFIVTVYGKAAHAGLDPEGGASAILELSHVIQKLFALNDPAAGVSVNVGTIDGGLQANVIAPHSKAVVDVRVPTNRHGEDIEAAIQAIRPENPDIRLRIDGGIGRPAMEATPANVALWRQAQEAGAALGIELASAQAGGGSDGNTTSQFTATLDGLGPVGDGAHAEHEFLYIDKTLERAALLATLLLAPPTIPDVAREIA